MTKTQKDDDEGSLKFTFDRSIRMEGFPYYFDRNQSTYYPTPTFHVT